MRILSLSLLVLPLAVAQTPIQAEWKAFSPKDGAFTILFPGMPSDHKKTITTPGGPLGGLYDELALPGAAGRLLGGYAEFAAASVPAATQAQRLASARRRAGTSTQAKRTRDRWLPFA